MFSFTRFCLRVLTDLNEIIRRMKRNVILTIAIEDRFPSGWRQKPFFCRQLRSVRLVLYFVFLTHKTYFLGTFLQPPCLIVPENKNRDV
jgi:hypothetical protein